MTEKELLDLKKRIQKAKEKSLMLKGEEKSLLGTLKKEWDCNSIGDAKEKLKTLEKKEKKLANEIETDLIKLEKELPNESD